MFLTVMTVAEALGALAPAHRSAVVHVAPVVGAVPARDVIGPEALPADARSTVDGYAVRAIDTYAASETLPAFLEVTGAVAMGRAPEGQVGPGAAMTIPTGGLLPHGADAVVMVEHTTEPMPGHVELMRRVAPGDGVLHPGEEALPGDVLAPAGRPLRAADLGLLAAAGLTGIAAHAPPPPAAGGGGRPAPSAGGRGSGDPPPPPRRGGGWSPPGTGSSRPPRRRSRRARCGTPARPRWRAWWRRPAASRCCGASSRT